MKRILGLAAVLLGLAACSTQQPTILPGDHVAVMSPHVLNVYPHDPDAFTQGLEFLDDSTVVESTGGWGTSSIRLVEAATGEVLSQQNLDAEQFGEGLAIVDDQVKQLTWKDQVLHTWSLPGLEAAEPASYEGEGWGLCLRGETLWRSDGSATLTAHDPQTFEPTGQSLQVQALGRDVDQLNELECTPEAIWANVWKDDRIVAIDPDSGAVVAVVDASSLTQIANEHNVEAGRGQLTGSNEVLNGIAVHPTTGHFWLTGKNWPVMFEVRFVDGPPGQPG